MKKILAFWIAICVILTSAFSTEYVFAASSVQVTGITLENCGTKKLVMAQGKTYALKTSIQPGNALNKKIIYSSSNKKVATVSKVGKIKARKPGKTTITLKSKGNKKIVQKIKVTLNYS